MITGMPDPPKEVLRNVFGFETFRGRQAEIISHVLAGRDALVLMPTGGGKSLCYQIPSICRPGVGVVVSAGRRWGGSAGVVPRAGAVIGL